MILTSHLLAGAAIASKISNPFLALPLALLSHYFLDSLPQEEYTITNIHGRRWNKTFPDFLKVFLDIFLGASLIIFFSHNSPVIYIAAFLAIVPDGITLLNRIFPENKLFNQHQKFHRAVNSIFDSKTKKIPFFLGVISQIAVVITAILLMQ